MTTEEQNRLCDQHMKELLAEGEEFQRRDERLLKVIEKYKPNIRETIDELLDGCSRGGFMGDIPFQLVKEPKGSYQREHHAWVQQWGVGMDGDSWEGNIYVKIRKNKYLKIFYCC